MERTKLKTVLKGILRLTISVGTLYYIFTIIDYKDIFNLLKQTNFLFILVAFLFFVYSKIVSAGRLNLFFKSIGVSISDIKNLKLYFLGMFYNLFLPGGIGGDGYKVYLLNKEFRTPVKRLIWVVFLDRLFGLVVLGLIALVLVTFIKSLGTPRHFAWVFLIIGILIVRFLIKKFLKDIFPILQSSILKSFLVQILQLISVVFLLMAHGEYNNYLSYLTIFLISSIVSILPVSIGGAGMRELTFLYGSQLLNLDMNLSVSISLSFYLLTAIASLAGVLYLFQPFKLLKEP